MFSEFGAPILEGFESNSSSNYVPLEKGKGLSVVNNEILIEEGLREIFLKAQDEYSNKKDEESDTDTSDEEEKEENEDTTPDFTRKLNNSNNVTVTTASNNNYSVDVEADAGEDENGDEDENEDNAKNNNTVAVLQNDEDKDSDSDDEDEDEDEDEDKNEDLVDNFFGGKIEHFSNKEISQKATSMNTILKTVMITCLFYVLAHKDSKKFIMGNVFKKVKGEYYLYIAMAIFFVVFYIITVFL